MRPLNALALVAILFALPGSALAQRFTAPGPLDSVSAPVELPRDGLFQDKYVRVGDDMFIGGQPTERALRELKAQGVTVIVNLRTPEEMRRVGFDESALAASLGMTYVYLPVRGGAEYPYSPETLTQFAQAISGARGKVLLHCTVAWRASHLWAAYLIQERKVPEQQALEHARAINLMDGQRTSTASREPIEEFLDRTVSALRRRSPP